MSRTSIISRNRRSVAGIAQALLLAAAFAAPWPAASAPSRQAQAPSGVSELEIRDAWIRWLPSGLPAAGYLTLVNHGAAPLELIAASSDAYREIGLHRSVTHDGMSHMEPVKAITVPAHSTLRFAAAGYHLMLLQPTHALAPGDHVALTLRFSGGAERTVSFEVRAPNGSAPAHGDMSGMPGMHDMQSSPPAPAQTPPR